MIEKEFELKYFNERSGVVLRPKKKKENDAEEMQKLLGMMGGASALTGDGS